MKKIGTILCLLLLTFLLEGCRMVKIKEADRDPLKYTVVEKQQLPEEAAALIEEKKEKEFQMAYQRGDEMYLIKGYGRQMSGGYSIQVTDLSVSSNATFFATKLIGPSESEKGGEPSYPWIAVKIPYREGPVEFD